MDALLQAGFTWVVDADLKSYFDTIPKVPMMNRLKEKISDGRILGLVESFLRQDIVDGISRWEPNMGTPQGAVISPLMANLYLHPLDKHMVDSGFRIVRYADDFVILCRNRGEAELALEKVRDWTQRNGLELHPDKTHVGNYMEPKQGFDFLGFHFTCGRRYVRRKSLKALRDKVREKTRRSRSGTFESIIAELNPMLRGWYQYFQHAYHKYFSGIDGFIRRRLRALLRSRMKRPGHGKCLKDLSTLAE